MRKILFGTAAAALAASVLLMPGTANAWWHRGYYGGGFAFFGPPIIYAPPPPIYYAPPPVYAAPVYAAPAGQTCYAGAYICPLDRPTPAGLQCSCPTNGGRAFGRAR